MNKVIPYNRPFVYDLQRLPLIGTLNMSIASFIERGFALGYFGMGLSLLINPQLWLEFIDGYVKGKRYFAVSFITLFLGSFMVAGHNTWEVSPQLITTIISWITFIKGVLLFLYPNIIIALIKAIAPKKALIQAEAIMVILLSSYILYYSV